MRRGEVAEALRQMRESFDEEWTPEYSMPSCTSEALELGAAYLWLKDYESAREHLDKFNRQYPRHAHNTYDMAGVARWCIGKRDEAVDQWRRGLDVDYADSGYGIKPVLLLFFASIVQPGSYSTTNAKELLAKRLDDPRTERWPGPIAEFILGRIDVQSVREKAIDKNEAETAASNWEINFWQGVLEYSRGNEVGYGEAMRAAGRLSWESYDACQRLFLSKLWSPEFYLARHEAGLDR
jgi:tetratricopeptide (TPR) repeat protein